MDRLPTNNKTEIRRRSIIVFCLFLGFEIQVRTVEEPNLRQVFGEEYVRYGQATGRFFPGLGRFRGKR